MCRTISLSRLNSYCSQRETSLRQKQHSVIFASLSQFGEPKKRHRRNAVLFVLYFIKGSNLQRHQLNSHCLLCKRTVKGRLGIQFDLITLVVLTARSISSLRPIPQSGMHESPVPLSARLLMCRTISLLSDETREFILYRCLLCTIFLLQIGCFDQK